MNIGVIINFKFLFFFNNEIRSSSISFLNNYFFNIYILRNFIYFLSIQKIIPFYILSLIEIKILILYLIILSSSYFSVIKIINLINFKILLTYSSINQTR